MKRTFTLRDYQRRDVQRIHAAQRRVRRVLYVLPTGGGKTNVAAALILSWLRQGLRVLFLAHRRELVNQAVARLIEAGVPERDIGVIMADDPRVHRHGLVQVASIDTLRRRDLPKADRVVIDEAHRATAPSYQFIADAFPLAKILGMTAIPYRLDGRGLDEVFDEMVIGPSPLELIAEGHLARPRTWTVPDELLPDLRGIPNSHGDFDLGALGRAANRRRIIGGIVDHWMKHAGGRRTVVFAVNIAHAKKIATAFHVAGVTTEHLDGSTSPKQRDAILDRLRSGETTVLTNCSVLVEGWDSPPVKCVVLARPTKSTGMCLQMAGRILRPWNDVTPVILDHSGNIVTHGLPQEERAFLLNGVSRRKGDGPVPCKTCPGCFAVLAAGTRECDACGHVFTYSQEPEETAGELTELGPVDGETRAVMARITRLAAARGFGPQWIAAARSRILGTQDVANG